jgi:c-di-GMP-binding flagellar brake protein YcgR
MEGKMTNEPTHGKQTQRQRRRYVRLEVFSPVEFRTLIIDENKRVRSHPEKRAGVLLNLSGGGVLISTSDQVNTNDLLLLAFEIKGLDALDNILGLVKRVEECEDGERLVGIEFIGVEHFSDPVLVENLSRLSKNPMGFSDSLKRFVSRYVFQRQLDTETNGDA